MKKSVQFGMHILRTSVLTLALACTAMSHPVSVSVNTIGPISMEVSLVTASTISLGEPVLLQYQVKNISDQKLGIQMGAEYARRPSWYTVSLIDDTGRPARALPDSQPVNQGGLFSIKNGYISAGGADMGYIAVTQLFALSHPGRYRAQVHVHLPYVLLSGAENSASDSIMAQSGETYMVDFAVPFTVTQTNPDRLKTVATSLEKAYKESRDAAASRAIADELFSMPEAQASARWAALATQPGAAADIARRLSGLHTTRAADILLHMLDQPFLSSAEISIVADQIGVIYNSGDSPLRQHIKAIAVQRGFQLPEKIPLHRATE